MGAKLRETRRRIRGYQSMMRITRAMELISASRIVRAQERVRQSRPYAREITRVLQAVAAQAESLESPLLEERAERRAAAVLVVTSDRGLCGAFNTSVLRRAEELFARLRQEDMEPKLFVMGRKGLGYYRFRGRPVEASWVGFSDAPTYDHAKAAADALIESFVSGAADEIHIVYTDFVSAMLQRPEARRLVPLVVEEVPELPPAALPLYEFEPGPGAILAALLPRYVEARIYAALLESAASEHAARQRAMSAATDNAEDLVKVLTRVANQARQAEITQEIMEVVGGAEALASHR